MPLSDVQLGGIAVPRNEVGFLGVALAVLSEDGEGLGNRACNASIDPNRDGVQKELAVADKIRRQNPNFIVPVRIDNVSYNDLPVEILRLNAIDFYNDWAKGLETLLKYLNDENIVKVMSNTDSQHYIDRWFSSQTKLRSQTVDNEDEYCSNLFALDLPESVFIYKREDVGPDIIVSRR